MKRPYVIALLLLALLPGSAAAQKASQAFDEYAYFDVIRMYERLAAKGYKDADMLRRLADSYYFTGKYDKAEPYYRELFAQKAELPPLYHGRYAQCLRASGHADEAAAQERLYLEKHPARPRMGRPVKEGGYRISEAGINSSESDYGAVFLGSSVVFVTARDTGGFVRRRHSWDGKAFSSLYVAPIRDSLDSLPGKPRRFSKELESRFHESTLAFAPDGRTVYFTRNDLVGKKRGKDAANTTRLKLYRATLQDSVWTDIVALPFNVPGYNTAHPALTADGKTLFFASDRPGTLGESDIYKVAVLEDGGFGEPENLGPVVNSPMRDTFPFVDANGDLYFASDGQGGLGGLDLFVAPLGYDGIYLQVRHLGGPVNSPSDDFTFAVHPVTRKGFFASNRPGGKGSDDLYRLDEWWPDDCVRQLQGIVADASGQPLAGATVALYNDRNELVRTVQSDGNGQYDLGRVDCESDIRIRTELSGFDVEESQIVTGGAAGVESWPVSLRKRSVALRPGMNLADKDALDIPIIHFDLDRWEITPQAAFQLEKVLAVLEAYPNMQLEVRSHTDSRQSHAYNLALSERRAASTVAWLVAHGIDGKRLSGKGFGETRLVNGCADDVSCPEAEHQANRRSEFVVTRM